jgi:tetratricopeptide (TPR) repeat protein
MMRQLIGQAYEPHFADIGAQVEATVGHAAAELSWWLSAVTQAGLFFKYLASWFWPDTGAMSIDWRVDFFATSSAAWSALKVVAFVACGWLSFMLVRRNGRAGLIGFGVLYAWILFLVELTVSRFQEPYVLYRSYLWAPGFAMVMAATLDLFHRRVALATFAVVAPFLFYQAHDRLTTFASPLRLWEDAASKLPEQPVPWGSRVLYNLGREYLYAEQPDKAIGAAERCMSIYPGTFQCVYARGAIHFQLEQFESAMAFFERAAAIEPKNGIVQHRIGMTLEKLERIEEAKQRYRKAASLGYRGGDMELGRLGVATGAAAPPANAVPAKP